MVENSTRAPRVSQPGPQEGQSVRAYSPTFAIDGRRKPRRQVCNRCRHGACASLDQHVGTGTGSCKQIEIGARREHVTSH